MKKEITVAAVALGIGYLAYRGLKAIAEDLTKDDFDIAEDDGTAFSPFEDNCEYSDEDTDVNTEQDSGEWIELSADDLKTALTDEESSDLDGFTEITDEDMQMDSAFDDPDEDDDIYEYADTYEDEYIYDADTDEVDDTDKDDTLEGFNDVGDLFISED